MKKILVLSLVSLAFQTQATSLVGSFDCAEWFQKEKSEFAKTWLTGYLSGMNAGNFFLGDKTDYLREPSVNEMILWMNGYCKANPKRTVADGANVLIAELYEKAKKP